MLKIIGSETVRQFYYVKRAMRMLEKMSAPKHMPTQPSSAGRGDQFKLAKNDAQTYLNANKVIFLKVPKRIADH